MEEYWKALIRGMTPESKSETHMIWAAPALVIVTMVILSWL
jgi:cytochrome c-type biogenesis protein CcmH/NrfF